MSELLDEIVVPSSLERPATESLKRGAEDRVFFASPRLHSAESATEIEGRRRELLEKTLRFADDLSSRPNEGSAGAPVLEVEEIGQLGLLTAPLPFELGGLGLGTEANGHLTLLRVLAAIGGGDLSLGRLYEGHVNALVLIAAYGSAAQKQRAARDAAEGKLFGVWNTGSRDLLRLEQGVQGLVLRGEKTFASGAAFVQRPIVTAEQAGGGWQMTMPRMESVEVLRGVELDRSFWRPMGMEASESFGIRFDDVPVAEEELIGKAGDFYCEPLFRGGAIRFAAVQAGAILRLHRLFAEWLMQGERGGDPYQVARLGEIALGSQEAVLWIERAAAMAEQGLCRTAGKMDAERMLECANMTRLAIERIATAMMPRVIAGVGAHGLLQPYRFERIVRDLTTYLRQPSPDQVLADVGRDSLRKTRLRVDGAMNGIWYGTEREASLPQAYFDDIYRKSGDPWNFENSVYEAAKYDETIASLLRTRYENGLEIGCSVGVLTARLAEYCDRLLGVDVSEYALERARQRCAALKNVRFAKMQAPRRMPEGMFDLVVVSEVAYYWQRAELEYAATVLAARQRPGSHLILVHYTGPVPDYPMTGDEVHELWCARPEWRVVVRKRAEGYRLNVLERCKE